MKRRDFLGIALATSGTVALTQGKQNSTAPEVRTVLAMFKCHFDLGFIDTQAGVMRKYFQEYFPHAIQIAQSLRDSGEDRYIWTTGSWLLYEYLEQAGTAQRKQMEQAVSRGDIAWHALPFSWQTELMDQSLIKGAIGFSKSLDRRFGRTTTGAKMTDVPGHSRGLIAPLAESGVTFLDIGVNSASTPPDVPAVFIWKDPDGNSIVMMYHRREYGGVVRMPHSDLAISVNVRDDNLGPHTIKEIAAIYSNLRQQFPNAHIRAASLTDIANAVQPFRSNFPVVTQEIGDTWIYGVGSDPVKVARYREVLRLRQGWIDKGVWQTGSDSDVAFLRNFSLAVEHTWGTDTKTWLDFDHYTPHDLAQVLDQPHYQTVTKSWVEKRDDIEQGVQTLPAALRDEAQRRMASLKPVRPSIAGLKPHDAAESIETRHFTCAIHPKTGAIRTLRSKASQKDWAGDGNPLGLFAYQTLSKEDYHRFLDSYVLSKEDWAPKDFGKPNIEHFGAQSRTWTPAIVNCWSGRDDNGQRVVSELKIDDAAAEGGGLVAWPERMYIELLFRDEEPTVHLNFSWFGKKANRLPEALWLTFQPNAPEQRKWMLDKVDRPVSPFDVISGGNRHMHAVSKSIAYKGAQGGFSIETLDAPLLALGVRSPIYFSKDQPDIGKGIHFSLFNNGWGTNYVQWFGEDMQFRFVVSA